MISYDHAHVIPSLSTDTCCYTNHTTQYFFLPTNLATKQGVFDACRAPQQKIRNCRGPFVAKAWIGRRNSLLSALIALSGAGEIG
jgi:hypothetical protein